MKKKSAGIVAWSIQNNQEIGRGLYSIEHVENFKAGREVYICAQVISNIEFLLMTFPDDHVSYHSRVHSIVRSRIVHFCCDLKYKLIAN